MLKILTNQKPLTKHEKGKVFVVKQYVCMAHCSVTLDRYDKTDQSFFTPCAKESARQAVVYIYIRNRFLCWQYSSWIACLLTQFLLLRGVAQNWERGLLICLVSFRLGCDHSANISLIPASHYCTQPMCDNNSIMNTSTTLVLHQSELS